MKRSHQKTKNEFAINAAALQDHYARTLLSRNAQKVLKLPSLNPKPALPHKSIPLQSDPDALKLQKFRGQLTLAQKLGLIPSPPPPLTADSWRMIEDQARKRKEGEGMCPICLEGFKGLDQVILSCSHMFHRTCLQSFERLCKVRKMCPICRKEGYDQKETDQGYIEYRGKCIVRIQKLVRGFLARKGFFEALAKRGVKAKLLKRRLMAYRLKNIGKRIDKNLAKKSRVSEEILARVERTVQEKTHMIFEDLNELKDVFARKIEDQDKAVDFVFRQYEGKVSEQRTALEGKSSEGAGKEWLEIRRKAIERCGDECAICLNSLFKGKKPLYLLSCSHVFHTHCVEALERYDIQERKKCPICREQYRKMSFGGGDKK